jgi:hypothetical protein
MVADSRSCRGIDDGWKRQRESWKAAGFPDDSLPLNQQSTSGELRAVNNVGGDAGIGNDERATRDGLGLWCSAIYCAARARRT